VNSNLTNSLERVMSPEQFNQVVSAILDGKYSWACLLILQFAGYNPLHYIPYRTYNRLMKENRPNKQIPRDRQLSHENTPVSNILPMRDCFSQIEDLSYLETLQEPPQNVSGGNGYFWRCHILNSQSSG